LPSPLISLLAQYHPERGWLGTWSPGIGDPTLVGWLTVVAYLIAAWLCLRVYRRLPGSRNRGLAGHAAAVASIFVALVASARRILRWPMDVRLRALWLSLAVVLFFLAVNKQLDLQTALTELGRIMARSEGWYAIHRRVQEVFIFGVLLMGAWLFRTVLLLASGNVRQMAAVLVGAVFLICFVAIRASSFHHVDRLLGLDFAGFKLNWILELGGNALVILGAWRASRAVRRSEPPSRRDPSWR
jgi:hypothetical protein